MSRENIPWSEDLLQENIEYLYKKMEEMAGMPKEKLGERQPGERNSYETSNLGR